MVVEEVQTIQEETKENVEYSTITLKILGASDLLQEIDDYFNELPQMQSKVDEELSDLLHYIENKTLTQKQSVKMVKLLQQKRLERRGLCRDFEIKKVYNENRNKLAIDSQRQFFLNTIHRKTKELNSQYRNRRFTDKEIEELLK